MAECVHGLNPRFCVDCQNMPVERPARDYSKAIPMTVLSPTVCECGTVIETHGAAVILDGTILCLECVRSE